MDSFALNLVSVELGGRNVVDRVSSVLPPGCVHVLIGPNGAGKSTLMKAMSALLPLSTGTVSLNGADVARMSPARRADQIAYLPQDRTIAWDLAAADVAALGAWHLTPDLARLRALEELTALGLQEVAERGVFGLSGGQRARVLLARVLVGQARIYVLDEPLIALDPAWQRHVLVRLRQKAAEGCTVVLSLHDLPLASQFADSLLMMHDGRLVAAGPPETVLSSLMLRNVFNLSGELTIRNGQRQLDLSPVPLT